MQKNPAQMQNKTVPCSQASILTRGGFFVILYHKVDYQTLRKNKKSGEENGTDTHSRRGSALGGIQCPGCNHRQNHRQQHRESAVCQQHHPAGGHCGQSGGLYL